MIDENLEDKDQESPEVIQIIDEEDKLEYEDEAEEDEAIDIENAIKDEKFTS